MVSKDDGSEIIPIKWKKKSLDRFRKIAREEERSLSGTIRWLAIKKSKEIINKDKEK